MTDKQWESVIDKCRKKHSEYKKLLQIAEDEYLKRYGFNPSDVDDNLWIDLLHYSHPKKINIDEIKKSAEFFTNL
jgi:hypothetical protein